MVVSPVRGQGEVKQFGRSAATLTLYLFTYVHYDDNVILAVLVCAFVDLIYSFSTRVDYL